MAPRGNYKFLEKFSWYVPGIGGMLALLAWLLAGALFGGILMMILGAVAGQEAMNEYGMLISYPVMFIPPMLYAAVKSSSAAMSDSGFKLDSNNFAPLGGLVCALVAAAGTLAMGFWSDAISALLPEMPEYLEEALNGLTNGNIFINLLCVSVFAPLCEEWLCRGMVLRGLLARGKSPVFAISISALFFALIHMNPWQAVPAFLLGCLFGYVYYKTGSLKLTMLMHCVNNTFAVIISRIPAFEEAQNWAEVLKGPAYGIVIAATLILTALTVLAFSKIRLKYSGCNCDPVPSIFESNEA